jgi:hypothetical protein
MCSKKEATELINRSRGVGKIRTNLHSIPYNLQRNSHKSRMPESAASPINACRRKTLHNYHDRAQVTEPDNETDLQCGDEQKGPVGGVKVPFPTKLHLMLSKVEESGLRHIVSW